MRGRPPVASMAAMSFTSWFYDSFLSLGERRGMAARRAHLLRDARGRVLEIGAGTGLNLAHYPADLDELVLTEPVAAMASGLHRRVAALRPEASVVEASADALPFGDAHFDTVVSTLVLCTVPDTQAAVAEIRRVLRPGGRLLFIEHVLAESPRLARWQRRLAPAWRVFGDGCNCDRDTIALLQRTMPVEISGEACWAGMPHLVHPLVIGEARA